MASPSNTLQLARPGDQFLISVPNYWARGATMQEAKAKLAEAGGRIGKYWRVHSVHEETYLDAMGYIVAPIGHEPIVLAESNPS